MKMMTMTIKKLELEYDSITNENEIRIIKDAVNDLQIAVKCIGDAIGKLGIRIKKIEDRTRRD